MPTKLPFGCDDPIEAAESGPASACEPYREVILAKLEKGLSAKRIWQELAGDHGFGHG